MIRNKLKALCIVSAALFFSFDGRSLAEAGEHQASSVARTHSSWQDFSLVEAQVRQESAVTIEEFRDFTNNYYRVGSPSRAPRILQFALSNNFDARNSTQFPTAYLFARVAQLNPGTARGYEALWSTASHAGRLSILLILIMGGDNQTRTFLEARAVDSDSKSVWPQINAALKGDIPIDLNILERKITTATDLDLLWGEFIVTGKKAPVIRIVDVLEWPDRLRTRLEEWLQSKAVGPVEQRRVLEGLAKALDIPVRSEGNQFSFDPKFDLDILAVLEGPRMSREKLERVEKALPFTLADEDVTHMGIKASAIWSLAGNLERHAVVLEMCRQEKEQRSEKAKLLIQQILARSPQ